MNMRPFTGRCHTCGHDHDADVTTLRDVLDITDKARDAEIAALRAEIHLLRILEKSLPVCQKENDGLRAAATSLVEQNDSLRAEVERLRVALMWYADEARALGKSVATGVHTNAVLASVTVLALDAGSRAEAAMRQEGGG